jgi:hypothetical protein
VYFRRQTLIQIQSHWKAPVTIIRISAIEGVLAYHREVPPAENFIQIRFNDDPLFVSCTTSNKPFPPYLMIIDDFSQIGNCTASEFTQSLVIIYSCVISSNGNHLDDEFHGPKQKFVACIVEFLKKTPMQAPVRSC